MPKKSLGSDESLAIACIRCRRRKKKCDQKVPKCGECLHSSSDCVRFEKRRPRDFASVPWGYVQGLEARLARVEQELFLCKGLLVQAQGNLTKSPVTSSHVAKTTDLVL